MHMHMLVFALLFEHHAIPCTPCFPCADPGFFVRGVGGGGGLGLGQSDKKSPDNVQHFPGRGGGGPTAYTL